MSDMDRAYGIFVDGVGAAAATSGILSQLQGRIFALLYLRAEPLALEDIAAALGQSKSNVPVNTPGLVEWPLVRRVPTPGSRKDHYEAATGFWRVMQEIMERRFRWTVRQVLATIAGTETAPRAARAPALRMFFQPTAAGFGASPQGKPLDPASLATVVPLAAARPRQRR